MGGQRVAQTAEQRREAARVRMQQKRARERAETDAKRAAAANARNAEAPTTMRDAVNAALAAAKWLKGTDAASIAQARTLARRVDLLDHADDVARSLTAQRALSHVLSDLGMTATKRLQYELRSLKVAGAQLGAEGEREQGEGEAGGAPVEGSNVSQFKRPAKRKQA